MSKRGSCWVGYEQKGMKKKGNKMVPNCVPAGMKKGGLKKWFQEKWVDISAPKKGGGYKECGRKSASGSKRGYPKCVPAAKAARMTKSEKRSAVVRKRQAPNIGPKPTNVKTILKRDIGGDVKKPGTNRGKFKVNLFTFDMPKTKYGDNIITAIEDTKVDIDPNLNYNKIYKNNVELDVGISSKGKGGFRIRKRF